jgi:pimeloyl-ACP methyl ester carboxylesterase
MSEVVFVHGAWHDSSSWRRLIDAWPAGGPAAGAIDLPSVSGDGSLTEDADALVAHCVGRERVVLVAHSYGGAVCTEAAAAIPGLRGVVYVAGLRPTVGQSVDDATRLVEDRGDIGGFMVLNGDDQVTLAPGCEAVLYGDTPDEVVRDARERWHPQARRTISEPLSRDVPFGTFTAYVICLRDRTVPVGLQRLFAARCDATVELDTSHTPQLEAPSDTAALLLGLATRAGE